MAPPSEQATRSVSWDSTLEFCLNGRRVTLVRPSPEMKLIQYLRDVAELPGTKLSCGEGGCGACTVVLCHRPLEQSLPRGGQADDDVVFRAVNACLFPVCALDGIEVFTIERVGSTVTRLHALQQRLRDANGTQCGFCTPGWIMNMYELLRRKKPLTKAQIENHFDGNLCRCTGYRPILSAFHTFASDPNEEPRRKDSAPPVAIEYDDLKVLSNTCDEEALHEFDDWLVVPPICDSSVTSCAQTCKSGRASCTGSRGAEENCHPYLDLEDLLPRQDLVMSAPYDSTHEIPPSDFIINFKPRPLHFVDETGKLRWYRPLTWDHMKAIFEENCLSEIMFVGGRTTYGVTKYYNATAPYNRSTERPVQVEINYIPDLKTISINANQAQAVVGGGVTINTLLQFLQTYESDQFDVSILRELGTLVHRVANNQVRNTGTWAGNLSLCRDHPSFVSDLVVGFMGADATLTLMNEKMERIDNVTIDDYLHKSSSEFVMIVAIHFPLHVTSAAAVTSPQRQRLCCYKVAQRPVNAHSHVNCAIWLSVRVDEHPNVCIAARIVFGGVTKRPSRFPATEKFLKGSVLNENTLLEASTHLEKDVEAIGASEAFGSQAFRRSVMKNLLYKAFLSVLSTIDDPTVASASAILVRDISTGTQSFKPSDATAPVSQAIQKIGAKLQVTGEAIYVADKKLPRAALYGSILYSTTGLGTLLSIDKECKTRKIPGVVDILTASDIPGDNDISGGAKEELLFVPIGGVVRAVGVPVGVVLAESPEIAERAVSECEVEYGAVSADQLWSGQKESSPITDIRTAKRLGTLGSKSPIVVGDNDVARKIEQCELKLSGELTLGAQKHFYMEPQVSVASLEEGDVFVVETSSQFPQFTQQQLAAVLGVKFKDITVKVQRVGGGFGGKLTRCVVNAAAAALGARKHRRPVRVVNDRSADFRLVGGREPMLGSYSVGFNSEGYIQALDLRLDVDCGYTVGDSAGSATMAVQWSDSAYHIPSFRCQAFLYLTNTQTCTSHRAPGVPQALVLVEAALHHVAEYLELPMRWIQDRNLYKEHDKTPYDQELVEVRLREVWDRLIVSSNVAQREEAIALFNSNNKWKKRGIAMTPTKYGMDYSARKDASRIEIFAGDGSVILSHGGCEIGQVRSDYQGKSDVLRLVLSTRAVGNSHKGSSGVCV
ncbi:hypothetical protein PINS_up003682 [Pythium insidiosum]|nr:hypothetical protein PINS_up003682 [Pythium insidiosum]